MLDNSRVRLWNLWRKRLPKRKRLCGDPNTKERNILCNDPNTKGTAVMDLPEDVIVNILLRLPVKSLCRVQCVSKKAFDIARSPGFATLHTLSLLDSAIDSDIFKFPQLILLTKSSNQKFDSLMTLQSLEYSSGKKKLTKTRQSDLVSKICFGNTTIYYELEFVYCNLLCFNRGYGVPRLLVNPLRGEILTLPGDDIGLSISIRCGMGFDPITSTYKIVYINARQNGNKSNKLMAQVLVLGTSSWRKINLVSRRDASNVNLGTTAYTPGYMHRLILENDGSSYIISFDFSKEELKESPCPLKVSGFSDSDKLRLLTYSRHLKLLNLKGSLAIVNCCLYDTNISESSDCIEIWVLKSYEKKEWELRHRIEKDELKLNVHHYLAVVSAETCVAWEHGICFASHRKICYFLDLRQPSMTIVELPTVSSPSIFSYKYWTKPPGYTISSYSIFGYTETLISLKNYGSVIKATESKEGEWHIDQSMFKGPERNFQDFSYELESVGGTELAYQ